MKMTPWNPFRELDELTDRFSRLFGRAPLTQGKSDSLAGSDWVPPVDIVESDKEYLVKVELPDIPREAVKVQVEDGMLRIEGERKQETEEDGKRFHRIERTYGSFVRAFTIPENIDEGGIRAEFKDGILNVRLPKTEKAKPKGVQIKVN
ncbi:MAG TPA: Hsp20/alpha crystallin family protein [Planctomycetota bacterium]|nr:Hsp20/alpha crystallin family protein [Planctomycetota bacterium]